MKIQFSLFAGNGYSTYRGMAHHFSRAPRSDEKQDASSETSFENYLSQEFKSMFAPSTGNSYSEDRNTPAEEAKAIQVLNEYWA